MLSVPKMRGFAAQLSCMHKDLLEHRSHLTLINAHADLDLQIFLVCHKIDSSN